MNNIRKMAQTEISLQWLISEFEEKTEAVMPSPAISKRKISNKELMKYSCLYLLNGCGRDFWDLSEPGLVLCPFCNNNRVCKAL